MHEINNPYSSKTFIKRRVDIGAKGTFELRKYKFTSGHCDIIEYVLDNDNDDTNIFVPITGVIGLKTTNCANNKNCRTV